MAAGVEKERRADIRQNTVKAVPGTIRYFYVRIRIHMNACGVKPFVACVTGNRWGFVCDSSRAESAWEFGGSGPWIRVNITSYDY